MNKLLFTFLFCFCCASLIFAQSLKISGRITDAQSKAPLEFANIVLTTADTTFVGGATSNINGDFLVENVVPGDYRLVVSSVGYKTSETVLQGVDEVVNLGSLELEENSVLLDEVTVAASNEKSNSDRKIVFPSDKQKKASSNGIELLKQIALPRLQVNALQRTLSVPGGGEVQLRINGIIATNEEVIALLPEDIIKIEYHDNPGLRYGNAAVVLDYITKRKVSGGNVSVDFTNAVNAVWGEDQLSAKVNHKKSEFSLSYRLATRDFYQMWRENEEKFNFGDGKVINRKEVGQPGHLGMYWQNASMQYNYQPDDKTVLNATFRYFGNEQDHFDYYSDLYFTDRPNDILKLTDKTTASTKRPSLDLYFQKTLPANQLLVVNVVGTYIGSKSGRFYQENQNGSLITDIQNNVDGKKYSIIAESIYEKQMKAGTFSAGLKHSQAFSDNTYTNGKRYVTEMRQADTYAYISFKGKLKNLEYNLGIGGTRAWSFQEGDGDGYETYTFNPRLTLQYNFPSNAYLRLQGSVNNNQPSLSELSAVDQRIDSLQIVRGNPLLQPYTSYQVNLSGEARKGIFTANLWSSYEYRPKAIMDEKFVEGNRIINTFDNQKSWQRLSVETTLKVKPLKDLLQVSATGGVNHYLSDGNTYNHEYTNWFYRGDLSFVYKKVMLAFQIQSNWNWFWGENVYGGENYHLLQAKYNMKNCSIGLGVFNPFSDNYKVVNENWSQHATIKKANYINESSRLVMVQFSWNLSFGRKYASAQKKLQNSDSDSGIVTNSK